MSYVEDICHQCKKCAVENTAVLDCADESCRCHTDHICGGELCVVCGYRKKIKPREHTRGEHSDDPSDIEICDCTTEQKSSISWLKGLAIKKSSIVPRGELWVNKKQYDE